MVSLRTNLALILSLQKVLEEVPNELQRNVFECKGRPVEQLEEVLLGLFWILVFGEGDGGSDVGVAECRVGSLNEELEVGRGDLCGRYVQREDLVGELLEGERGPGGKPV